MTILLDYQNNPEGLREALAGENVSGALMCEMQFASGTLYLTNSLTSFTVGGVQYRGLGDLVSVAAVKQGPRNLTPVMRYGLGLPKEVMADDEGASLGNVAAVMSDPAEYAERLAILSLQVFRDGAPYGSPVVMHTGRLSRPRIEVQPGQPLRFSILAESVLVRKRLAPAGKLTDKDQQSRHAGDLGLGFVINATSEPVDWLND